MFYLFEKMENNCWTISGVLFLQEGLKKVHNTSDFAAFFFMLAKYNSIFKPKGWTLFSLSFFIDFQYCNNGFKTWLSPTEHNVAAVDIITLLSNLHVLVFSVIQNNLSCPFFVVRVVRWNIWPIVKWISNKQRTTF